MKIFILLHLKTSKSGVTNLHTAPIVATKILFSVAVFLLPFFSDGQVNLVPNPSFEDTIACPDATDQMNRCADWWSAGMPNCSSPDYFHGCSTVNTISPPEVAWGDQIPVTGNAYSFVINYFIFPNPCDGREYIQTQLTNTLVIGQKYYISFYVNLGGRGGVSIASNKLGALFTTYAFT
ncbi:MAG: hypothetical protein ACR2KB_13340, partial [Chitinophagaceae bacterium]